MITYRRKKNLILSLNTITLFSFISLPVFAADICSSNSSGTIIISTPQTAGDNCLLDSADINSHLEITSDGVISEVPIGILIDNVGIDNIVNHGDISTDGTGVFIVNGSVNQITNSGTISGVGITSGFGIHLDEGSSASNIINEQNGIIKGNTAAISVENAGAIINNSGLLDGDVFLKDNILNINGSSARIAGIVSGINGSNVNINGDFTSERDFSGVESVNILSGARFNLHNKSTFSIKTLKNTGTIAVATGNRANIIGDYTQLSNGVLEIGATSRTSYGVLDVTGVADLTESASFNVNVSANETLNTGDVLSGVLTADVLKIDTTLLDVTDNSALWDFTATVNGNDVDITSERALTITDAVDNVNRANANGIATVLDEIIGNTNISSDLQLVLDALNPLNSTADITAAMNQLTPSFSGSVATLTRNINDNSGSRIVRNRVKQLQTMAAKKAKLDPSEWQGSQSKSHELEVWLQPFFSKSDQDVQSGVTGYEANSTGFVLGIDKKFKNAWYGGGAISYYTADVKDNVQALNDSLDITAYQASIYASGMVLADKTLNVQTSFGVNSHDSVRVISFGGLNRQANADYNSQYIQLGAELIYSSYTLPGSMTLMPIFNARYDYLSVDGYTETGAGDASLIVGSDNDDSFVLSAGGKLAYSYDSYTTFTTSLSIGYDILASDSSISSTLIGGGGSFITQSIDTSSTVLDAGFGYILQTRKDFALIARYDLQSRSNLFNQSLSAKLRWQF